MYCIGVLPARYRSTRFPGKPLALIADKPMIQHVYERSVKAASLAQVYIATDDDRIRDAALEFTDNVVMTSPAHQSGTDRVAEAIAGMDVDLVVNIQGDEPLIEPQVIDAAVKPLTENSAIDMGTLACALSAGEAQNSNVVKVVFDTNGRALYFSRAPIPFHRSGDTASQSWQHIGLYVYRADFLHTFTKYPLSSLEKAEQLEQLRALEHGHYIHVEITEFTSTGVDTKADLKHVRKIYETGDQRL
ncbi:MAG: 3-deoxy-manno-octulosonate cytidylyltransferase [Candidatus Marinimicrobia bacterium]|nr:3-deoxy-manno-octulosonate cytidylyltransferase [Candidatus Neomarinimicrobiota bacterium]